MTKKLTVARVVAAVTTTAAAALLAAAPANARVPYEPDRHPVVQAQPSAEAAGRQTSQATAGAFSGGALAGMAAIGVAVAARRRFSQQLVQN
ncbi:hypothetical protein [Kribbella sp. NPDC023855]|uniref:hypothetical protein n=1 Tax=Kribbella sp. NPDC023855 TaxID=3154698 RepID=UPI00340999F1